MSVAPTSALARLGEIVGRTHFSTDPGELARHEVDGLSPAAVARPGSAEEVAEIVRLAAAEKLAIIPIGAGTMLGIGAPPSRYDVALHLSRLNHVLAYDPGDLTLGVEPGIPLAHLQAVLAEKLQFLPLAPPFAGTATLGGILATNQSGALRHAYGGPRDYVLGMEFVTGEGIRCKSGGRVVKNVTGYDLHKLMIGALGTLGIMIRINLRTFPTPPASAEFVATADGLEPALALRRAIAQSPLQLQSLEIVSSETAALCEPETRSSLGPGWSVVVSVGGNERVVERHAKDLRQMAEQTGARSFTGVPRDSDAGRQLWSSLRDFPRLAMSASPAATIVRIGVVPTQMGLVVARAQQVAERNNLPTATLVRASGTIYFAMLPKTRDAEAHARLVRASAELMQAASNSENRGHAVIEWCPTELKRKVNVWGPVREDFPLMQKLKKVFDPQGIFSPGRFVGGI